MSLINSSEFKMDVNKGNTNLYIKFALNKALRAKHNEFAYFLRKITHQLTASDCAAYNFIHF